MYIKRMKQILFQPTQDFAFPPHVGECAHSGDHCDLPIRKFRDVYTPSLSFNYRKNFLMYKQNVNKVYAFSTAFVKGTFNVRNLRYI